MTEDYPLSFSNGDGKSRPAPEHYTFKGGGGRGSFLYKFFCYFSFAF